MENERLGYCVLCHKEVTANSFKDKVSYNEYHISGMCQACQDFSFGPPPSVNHEAPKKKAD